MFENQALPVDFRCLSNLRHDVKKYKPNNVGGSTRRGLVTAYRQDALRCAHLLARQGPAKAAAIARDSGVERARRLMADNHYGWFARVERGVYALTPQGTAALEHWHAEVALLHPQGDAATDPVPRADDPPAARLNGPARKA